MRLVKCQEVKTFHEGVEICKKYYETEKITFGSSQLEPGETGEVDWGHPASHEIFYGVKGKVLLKNPKSGMTFIIEEGDAVMVEEGEPHELTNIGLKTSITTWSCAPTP